jgi:hypothetical protein
LRNGKQIQITQLNTVLPFAPGNLRSPLRYLRVPIS